MSTSVFVSGSTGYIAQHIVKNLIEKGYKVVGTVRSAEKGDKLKASLKSDNFTYEIVKDIGAKGAFDEALKAHPEVTAFLHTASPFHFNTTEYEKDLLLPAIDGTKNALNAIKEYGPQIKRVVITSSYAAIVTFATEAVKGTTLTEESWNAVTWEGALENAIFAYAASKKFAEVAAWDFVKTEKPNFVLSTVNPGYVFGPQAFDSEAKGTLNTSAEIINNLLNSKPGDAVPEVNSRWVDVRDVARAHLVAFEKDEAKNQRLFLSEGDFSPQAILDILNDKFAKQLKGKIATGAPGTGFDAFKNFSTVNNDKTRKILGYKLTDLETSVVDTVQQLLDVNGRI